MVDVVVTVAQSSNAVVMEVAADAWHPTVLLVVMMVEEQHSPLLLPSPPSKEDVVEEEEDGRSRFHDRMECKSWVVRFSSSSS